MRKIIWGVPLLLIIVSFFARAQKESSGDTIIVQFDLQQQIDPSAWRNTKKAFQLARQKKAAAIIIHMNTYGGLVDAADSIRTKILFSDIPVYVYIDPNAASAGALIAISSNRIYMSKGATIGAATVVNQGGEKAPDKYQSYMRGIMRSTAEARGRDPEIAEAMVDENLEVDSISPKGQVITFTRAEAIKYGFADGTAENIHEVLLKEGYKDYEVVELHYSVLDKVINFLISPMVSGILILVMLGGIWFELQTPGVGFPLAAAVVAAIFYFAPLYLESLAANWEILLFFVGLILIGIEIFVIPGFGIAGIAGITFVVFSLILSLVRNDFFDFTLVGFKPLLKAVVTVLSSLVSAIVIVLVTGKSVIGSKYFQRLVLSTTLGDITDAAGSEEQENTLAGKEGEAYTDLYPSGKVKLNNEVYDAISEGEYISKGEPVMVLKDLRNKLLVRKIEA